MSDHPVATSEEFPGRVIAMLELEAERARQWATELRKFPQMNEPGEVEDWDEEAEAFQRHAAALRAIEQDAELKADIQHIQANLPVGTRVRRLADALASLAFPDLIPTLSQRPETLT